MNMDTAISHLSHKKAQFSVSQASIVLSFSFLNRRIRRTSCLFTLANKDE